MPSYEPGHFVSQNQLRARSEDEPASLSEAKTQEKAFVSPTYFGANERDSVRIKERRHEAYASVRLCTLDGDVIWSTTQESLGAKFRGASADVAAKIARQLTLDLEKARRAVQGSTANVSKTD